MILAQTFVILTQFFSTFISEVPNSPEPRLELYSSGGGEKPAFSQWIASNLAEAEPSTGNIILLEQQQQQQQHYQPPQQQYQPLQQQQQQQTHYQHQQKQPYRYEKPRQFGQLLQFTPLPPQLLQPQRPLFQEEDEEVEGEGPEDFVEIGEEALDGFYRYLYIDVMQFSVPS